MTVEEYRQRMMRDIKEGDVCILDESVEYPINPKKPYEVIVLWNGVNGQPLVTRCDKYAPFWSTYSQLIERVDHIDIDIQALKERSTGHWTTTQTILGQCCVCSECGGCPTMEYKYCPYCGAKMEDLSHV